MWSFESIGNNLIELVDICYNPPMAVSEYDSMASWYDKVLEPFLWKMRRKIIRVSNIDSGMKVLEVACGTGTQAVRFKKAGAEYTGVDLSKAMLEVAGKRKLECLHADGTELPLEDNIFDLSTITLALHEVDPEIRKQIVMEMIRVTRSDGFLVIVDYTLSGRKNIISSLSDRVIHYVEKLVGGSHYRNYGKFMKSGGLISFLEPFDLEIIEAKFIFARNIGIIKLQKSLLT